MESTKVLSGKDLTVNLHPAAPVTSTRQSQTQQLSMCFGSSTRPSCHAMPRSIATTVES